MAAVRLKWDRTLDGDWRLTARQGDRTLYYLLKGTRGAWYVYGPSHQPDVMDVDIDEDPPWPTVSLGKKYLAIRGATDLSDEFWEPAENPSTPRTKYWWRLDLYEPDELTTDKTHGLPFRRIEFRGPGQAHVATGKHRKTIQERLAKVGYRITGSLARGQRLRPRGEWEWRAGLWLATEKPGKEISGRVSQMERPFAIGPGPDQPVPKARGVNVIDWPRGRPNPRGEHIVWPIDQIMEIESRLEAGETVEAVANVMGVATSCIIKLADEAGMERRRRPPKGNPYDTRGHTSPAGLGHTKDEHTYRGHRIAISYGNMAGEKVWKAKIRDAAGVPVATLAGSTKADRHHVLEWARIFIDQGKYRQALPGNDGELFHTMDLEIWGAIGGVEKDGSPVTRSSVAREIQVLLDDVLKAWEYNGCDEVEWSDYEGPGPIIPEHCQPVWEDLRAHRYFESLPLSDRLKWIDATVKQYRLQHGLPTTNPKKARQPRKGRRRSPARRKLLARLLRGT